MKRNDLLNLDSERLFQKSLILYLKNVKRGFNPLGGENNDFHPLEFLEVHYGNDYKLIYELEGFYIFDFKGETLFAVASAKSFLNDSSYPWMVKISSI